MVKSELVQRFVDASIEGWYSYIFGDPKLANELIKQDNKEMTDDLLDYARKEIKKRGIVLSGDAKLLGIGSMTEKRWKSFYEMMKDQGLYSQNLDYSKAFTLKFVNNDKWIGFEKKYQ